MALDNSFFAGINGGNASPSILSKSSVRTAGGVYMAKLGAYMFSIDTASFQNLERTTQFQWEAQARIGRKPARQFTGMGDDTIELSGVIYPHFRGGIGQVAAMRAAAGNGLALPLIYAFESLGQYCGLWCITSIREGRTVFAANGAPRKIEFSLSLAAYGEDSDASAAYVSSSADIASSIIQLTSIAAPTLLGTLGDAVGLSASDIDRMTSIDQYTSLSGVAAVASKLGTVASNAMSIAQSSQSRILSVVGNIGEESGILPSGTLSSASELATTAGSIMSARESLQSSIDVLGSSPSQLKSLATTYAADMSLLQRDVVRSGSQLQSSSAYLSSLPHSDSIADTTRLTAAAKVGQLKRCSDDLLFACNESVLQATQIASKINA